MDDLELVPFLKWAGGKRWLVSSHPEIFDVPFSRYIEPFVGSAAVYFCLKPRKAILSDSNADLIDTYRAIRDKPYLVKRYLREHHTKHSREYYYSVRSASPRSLSKRAARLIYLNRTCWNALYRVNLKGEFNVPIGTKNTVILPTDNFPETSRLLDNVELLNSDFEEVINEAGEGDFLFVDPPYTVKHNLNGFIKYNEQIFRWEDQERLKGALEGASERGAKFLMTNANHPSIQELYCGVFASKTLDRHSVIAASSEKREKISEMLIFNFELPAVSNLALGASKPNECSSAGPAFR